VPGRPDRGPGDAARAGRAPSRRARGAVPTGERLWVAAVRSGDPLRDHPDLSARNVFIPGVGHMSLPIDRRVTHQIASTLAQLDHDGASRSAPRHLRAASG